MRTKEEQREYQRLWIKKRRDTWIAENGPCANCGSSESLEVDHIDRSTKLYNPRSLWSRRKDIREAELAKCQVLCHDCHLDKSSKEFAAAYKSDLVHGTRGGYENHDCRCDACCEALRQHWRDYRALQKDHSGRSL